MNPYEVLGIKENATDEEIKAAYKELVKKYHPDKYIDNPLADLAEQKMQEINEAYGRISARYAYDDEDEKYLWVEYSHSFESALVPFHRR